MNNLVATAALSLLGACATTPPEAEPLCFARCVQGGGCILSPPEYCRPPKAPVPDAASEQAN